MAKLGFSAVGHVKSDRLLAGGYSQDAVLKWKAATTEFDKEPIDQVTSDNVVKLTTGALEKALD